jgi:hypothetical protein
MFMNNKKGKGILLAENICKAAFIFLLLLLATTFVASAQPPCDHAVSVGSWCCYANTTAGWFYNTTNASWDYKSAQNAPLFNITIDGYVFNAYCIDYETFLIPGDNFNASIYPAEPSCKNNSIGHILNNWTQSCNITDCENVSAAQSAIWYFWYINDTFCSRGAPQYNHTAPPNQTGESYWIPNCTAHPEACSFINASINKSVPYNISITPNSRSFPTGTSVEIEARVYYCDGEGKEEVTVIFKANNGNISGSGNVYEAITIDGKANATLICDPSFDSVTVSAQVKDMKWFDIIEPCEVEYQETLGIVNITAKDAHFSFYTHRVPALSLPFLIVLAVLMSVIAIAAIRKKCEK